ncbi:MAG: hypothetical protein ABI423_12115, partial [Burkholderiales bacterium]
MPDIVIHAVTAAAAAAYAGLAWHFWRTRWRALPQGTAPAPGMRLWERAALLVPVGLQALLLFWDLLLPQELRFGFAPALAIMF